MIELSEARLARLRAYLSASEDAEALGPDEYTVDLYELEPPISMQLVLTERGIDVLAAAELAHDEALDGWYMGTRIEAVHALEAALAGWPPSA